MIVYKTINVIQFLSFEDLGNLKLWLKKNGYQMNVLQAGVDHLSQVFQEFSPLIILGGPIGVYETQRYPFLIPLIAQLGLRLKQNLPTLGICLGAQLIATALGARVYAGHVKEIGWSQLTLTEQAKKSPVRYLEATDVLHWHGDTFDLPESAQLLASSVHYPHQAFRVGSNILALQFHIEIEPQQFERWLIGHQCQLDQQLINIEMLRAQNLQYAGILVEKAHLLFSDWLAELRY